MTRESEGAFEGGVTRYRLELEGEIAQEWAGWFDADHIESAGGRAVVDVTVADQAALHGVLRRVHDLHLRLVSLTLIV
ncbi:MAG TPA: hypothetical protein VK939_15360 [Longimicrobiales bacterium]|nr:hypothetical protein [Longimicrobiales bacterium]